MSDRGRADELDALVANGAAVEAIEESLTSAEQDGRSVPIGSMTGPTGKDGHMHVAQFTLQAKPGHYTEVADLYSAFADEFLSGHPALESVLILGDEGSGVVRGIGVFTDRPAADSVNSDPEFAAFNDAVTPMLASPPERVELELLHLFTRT